jgi:AcrR family transcriptional regulator
MTSGKGSRAEKARQTRRRILEAARDLFLADGYGQTTLQAIADRAGVAVQTIYFTFGNKRTVLKELGDMVVAGDDLPIPTMERPWFQEALAARTADEQILALAQGARAILDRIAPIARVLRTATVLDPEIAELWNKGNDPRYVVYAEAARVLVDKPDARTDVSAAEAADVLFALLSPELYLLLVCDRGWAPDRWQDWAYKAARVQLLTGRFDAVVDGMEHN